MRKCLAIILASVMVLPALANAETEISSKAEKLTITGRMQAQWRHTTIEGEPSNEFLIRRARATVKVKINDLWHGVVQPDFGEGKFSLKDAYARFTPSKQFEFTMGQAKRNFDLFELTSSTQILVIERDGRIGNVKVPTLSTLTEKLGYSDRDIGLFAHVNDASKRFGVDVSVTNGDGANEKASMGEKAVQGRLSVQPISEQPLSLHGGWSMKPYETQYAGTDSAETEYANAFEAALEYGAWERGVHVQAAFIGGENWKGEFTDFRPTVSPADSLPTFLTVQGILTYKQPLQSSRWLESIEPLVRVSWADPNIDIDDDGGILITPGVNLFLKSRNRFSVNTDIFVPQDSDASVETSVKVQSWVYW